VGTGKLAPKGWHVPTYNDWLILDDYLIANGYNYDGTKESNKIAKSLASKTGWKSWDEAGTPGNAPENNNSTGFTGLPGGYRLGDTGSFYELGECGYWWSSYMSYGSSYFKDLEFCEEESSGNGYDKTYGLSVRCVKD
jgi:uncharacterized protein (TIGR02145 family)